MTTCPTCGRPVPAGALLCPSCGTSGPTLPDGLFRDGPLGSATADPQPTAAFTPDFLRGPDQLPVRPPAQPPPVPEQAPELPDDLFRSETPTAIRSPLFPTEPNPRLVAETPVRAATPPTSLEPERWLPLAAPGTPEGDLLPSERPPEDLPPVRTRSIGWVLLVLAALLLAAVIGGMIWWDSTPVPTATTATRSVRPSGSAATGASAAASPASSPAPLPTSAQPPAFPPKGATPCNATVAVNDVTSCAFALKVAAALKPMAEGASQTLSATSPTTGQTYQMTCRRAGYVTCTGGVNATVYVEGEA